MAREGAEAKSRRYLSEARLTVTKVDGLEVRAVCRGDGEQYDLGFDATSNDWWCSCPARTTRCTHLVALKLVTVRGRESIGGRCTDSATTHAPPPSPPRPHAPGLQTSRKDPEDAR